MRYPIKEYAKGANDLFVARVQIETKNYRFARTVRNFARAQVRAALAVNRELVLLYWSIGRDIVARQGTEGWGTRIIDRLAHDLQKEFPRIEGFSPRSLKYMRALAEVWPEETKVNIVVTRAYSHYA